MLTFEFRFPTISDKKRSSNWNDAFSLKIEQDKKRVLLNVSIIIVWQLQMKF